MPATVLATKLYLPPPRPDAVLRPRLVERLNEGLHRKLTLISAPAGFGKTTLVSEWIEAGRRKTGGSTEPVVQPSTSEQPAFCWLSLDEGDNDFSRFLTYLVAALQTVAANVGDGVLALLQSPQPPPLESLLTSLLNDITTLAHNFVLVLDDYHMIDAGVIDRALAFLVEHLPPQMHLVIATREDPNLPVARYRARGQLTELRAADLRFTSSEAAGFLNQAMGLKLSPEDVTALETRTEGWIAGLQLAAISLRGHPDASGFIQSFTGSHHFVLDYLVEEVLQRQPESVQTFLLRTSILERLCAPLCDAVLLDPAVSGRETLAYLERANLFIVPLDNERRWYRYHHLFADLLRQRLQQQSQPDAALVPGTVEMGVAGYHRRASAWYEDNGLEIEAFQHAAAANDIEAAERLIEGKGMPLLFRGAVAPVLNWLRSLPTDTLDARPSLWVMYASALLFVSQATGVEPKLQAAEAALQAVEPDERTRDLIGHIASIRATLAVIQHQVEAIIVQSRRALEFLRPDNLPVRTATTWTLGYAYHLQGDRAAAGRAYAEAISISQAIGHFIINIMATIGLANIQETENQLHLAVETYRRALQLFGDSPLPVACEAHLGLARIYYEWNDLEAAEQHGQQSFQLARQVEYTDRYIGSEVFLARLKLARGDVAGAVAMLAQTDRSARQHNFVQQMPGVAAMQVLALLRQGALLHQDNLATATRLVQAYELPISQARVFLAQGNTSAALAVLEPARRQMEARGWQDERLKAMTLQALTLHLHGDKDAAVHLLAEALALAEPGGFVRIFVDEGEPMRRLMLDFRLWLEGQPGGQEHPLTGYIDRLLAALAQPAGAPPEPHSGEGSTASGLSSILVEPLSPRETEILGLIAQGLSNREIGERLFLALSTVKGHILRIFGKLQVQRRTEAVARARELGLL